MAREFIARRERSGKEKGAVRVYRGCREALHAPAIYEQAVGLAGVVAEGEDVQPQPLKKAPMKSARSSGLVSPSELKSAR